MVASFGRDQRVVLADLAAAQRVVDARLERRERRPAQRGDVGARAAADASPRAPGPGPPAWRRAIRRSGFGEIESAGRQEQLPRLGAGRRHPRERDGVEGALQERERIGALDPGAAVVRAQRHLLGAAAAGDQADARLDEAHVGLRRRRTRAACSAISQPPPSVQPERRHHHRQLARTSAPCWRSGTGGWRGRARPTPLPARASSTSIRLAPTVNCSPWLPTTMRVEVRASFLDRRVQHGEGVGAERVHLGVELDEAAAVAEVDQQAPAFFLRTAPRALSAATSTTPGRSVDWTTPVGPNAVRGPPRLVEALAARGQQRSTSGGTVRPSARARSTTAAHARAASSSAKRPEAPAVAPLHGAVDRHHRRPRSRGRGRPRRSRSPTAPATGTARPCPCRRRSVPSALRGRPRAAAASSEANLRASPLAVLERLPVERADLRCLPSCRSRCPLFSPSHLRSTIVCMKAGSLKISRSGSSGTAS